MMDALIVQMGDDEGRQTMNSITQRPGTKPEIDDETRRIIEPRLATADHEPKQDAREVIEEIRTDRRMDRLAKCGIGPSGKRG